MKLAMAKYESQCDAFDEEIKQRDSKINLLQERLIQVTDGNKEMERILDYINDLTKANMYYVPTEGDKVDK